MGAVTVTRLGKAYRKYPTRWSRLAEWAMPWLGPRHSLVWVLRDVGFRVEPGEALGIVGANGAGKSTLLKLISGTAKATTGTIETSGRVAALLELGMGFHPDFTGRQNAFMACQLLGLSAQQIDALMPAIEDFAEIRDYIDQPVRIYSSGMQVRLAFSVATAVRPNVLIIDEALSVGDTYFQHKSFERIRQFRDQGTTLLLVSHDHVAVQSICDRSILLDRGQLIKDGAPEDVANFYNALIAEHEHARVEQRRDDRGMLQTVSGSRKATVEVLELLDESGRYVELVDVGQLVTLRALVRCHLPIPRLVLGYQIKDRLGQPMFGTNTHLRGKPLLDVRGGQYFEFRFTFPVNLGPGGYSVTTSLSSNETHLSDNYEWKDLALIFKVANMTRTHFVGCNWIEPEIQVSLANCDELSSRDAATDRLGSAAAASLEP